MKPQPHFQSVRLAVAGFASIFLLVWLGFITPNLPGDSDLIVLLGTALFCLVPLVTLTPVIISGSWRNRLLALLLTVFPILVLLSPFLRWHF